MVIIISIIIIITNGKFAKFNTGPNWQFAVPPFSLLSTLTCG